jgi:hypothetical protein
LAAAGLAAADVHGKECYNEDKKRPLFFTVRVPRVDPFRGREEDTMNRIEKKEMAVDAAKYFKEEVLESMPDIPRKELCDMVDDYIYYQTDDLSKEEAHKVVEATCLLNQT